MAILKKYVQILSKDLWHGMVKPIWNGVSPLLMVAVASAILGAVWYYLIPASLHLEFNGSPYPEWWIVLVHGIFALIGAGVLLFLTVMAFTLPSVVKFYFKDLKKRVQNKEHRDGTR